MMNTLHRMIAPALGRQHPRVPLTASKAADHLPVRIRGALDEATVHRRTCGGGAHRVIVRIPGSQGWYHSAEATPKALATRFPELTDEQVQEATAWLHSIVKAHVRVLRRNERGPNWATTW